MANNPLLILTASPEWRAAYPGAVAGALVLSGASNPAGHPALEQRRADLEQAQRERYAGLDRPALARLPVLAAYARYYRRFDQTYHVLRQLESVLKGRSRPGAAALVEAMFLAELDSLLLTAGHDLDALALPVRVDLARGGETYTTLRGEPAALRAGDMFMADASGQNTPGIVSSILSGPDQRTAMNPATQAVMFTVYAPPGISAAPVAAHLDALAANVRLFAPEARVTARQVLEAPPAG
jgi:DNA/RNA-binding domain of Phe-tRNA-synthetase-like protein